MSNQTVHGMPFLVVNYGAEMIFILDQRLQAQSVAPEKASKVLHDVIKAMFAPNFVEELLRPQPLYPAAQTKEIFDRLAHSSIMRLSENSMDKLYDLMTMGCKYQYVTLRHPLELVELTLNHLQNIRKSLTTESAPLKDIENRVRELSQSLTCGVLADVRHQLLNFFHGRRVKVSLFLQEGMQNTDATLNIPKDTSLPPLATSEAPGTIRYYSEGSVVLTETFDHPDSQLTHRTDISAYSPLDPATRQCTQGKNLYLIERKKKPVDGTTAAASSSGNSQSKSAAAATTASATAAAAPAASTAPPIRSAPSAPSSTSRGNAHVGALNSLASMITGFSGSAASAPVGTFKLNLFGDANDDAPSPTNLDDDAPATVIQINQVSREDMAAHNAELMSVVQQFGGGPANPSATSGGAGDELLDLMDSA
mmetsp:Transcript_20154/g.23239  ORF Transcript_20154/g.23239 Transcript_20154/m.23239 type:complete len:423 (-) Transcript_20154:233-1501(-)|eukprot:CAMPEP_0176422792 /NCGR_PEP_ID=MMETSP0127-20121128/9930_1 /TAXON_ID=938130 /ORGANISM="Platyophrya macrostoma, Strain WH" /LENGTH=422 /DNA_ID=CAMNT_0017803681 /DNA_START=115 /DNA_END=1383 /DNA_ORIENTATION=-